MQSYRNLVLLGPPGSGKGTQAERLRDELDLTHISTGELVRAHPEQTERYTRAGRLVPDNVVLALLEGALRDAPGGVLLDGFPRSVEQAHALEPLVRVTDVVFLDVPDDVVVERLARRGREDDAPDTVRERLAVYRETTAPLVDYYARRGLLRRAAGDGDPEEVHTRVQNALSYVP
jgi:adenylate kinase